MTGAPATDSAILRHLLRGHQEVLQAELTQARQAIGHPTLKGDASESSWQTMLSRHLPRRYRACRGVVVDSANRPIPDAEVLMPDVERVAFTDQAGFFRMPDVPEGTHVLS